MGRIDEDDEDAGGTRARGDEMDGEEFVSSNAMGGSARARSAARDAKDDGDGRDRGRSIRERILVVDRFGWVRV